jgi:ABC-type branched-subunit amino acid transport system ATPase component
MSVADTSTPDASTSLSAALRCEGLTKAFQGVHAVNGAEFSVPEGQITALIGPNGAGKTTVVNILSGAMKSDSGRMFLDETETTGWPSYKIARHGLLRTFQLSRELGGLTVLENLLTAAPNQAGDSFVNVLLRPGLIRRQEREHAERALHLLEVYGLYRHRDTPASDLSGGQKKLLEIARAVMGSPKVLLLDEPMAGVNPALIDVLGGYILDLKKDGVTVLMIEHNLGVVERICDYVIVLAEGKTLATGRLSDLRQNTEVVKAYLGEVMDVSAAN